MKQPQVPFPAPLPSHEPGPRYRYFSEPPETISLRLRDFWSQVPEAARILGADLEQRLELPAAKVFSGPSPAIPISLLVELAPDAVKSSSDEKVRLPVSRLISAYQLVHRKELIEEIPPTPEPLSTEEVAEATTFAPPPPVWQAPEVSPASWEDAPPPAMPVNPPSSVFDESAPTLEPPSIPSFSASSFEPPVVLPPVVPEQAPSPVASVEPPLPPELPEAPPSLRPPAPELPKARSKIFSVLPIFRRKPPEEPDDTAKKGMPIRRARIELPPPKIFIAPPPPVEEAPVGFVPEPPAPAPVTPESFAPPAPEYQEPAAYEAPPKPPFVSEESATEERSASNSFVMEPEHVSPAIVKPAITRQGPLQALFLTEDFLTVDRVLELCGGLPGVNACILSHRGNVISSHHVPDSIDLVSLSGHALEMLNGLREATSKMGVGSVPAVTIHSEKGPITFFHRDDVCLLVLHQDRGFIPGVREKLQSVVGELNQIDALQSLSSQPPPLPPRV